MPGLLPGLLLELHALSYVLLNQYISAYYAFTSCNNLVTTLLQPGLHIISDARQRRFDVFYGISHVPYYNGL